MTCSRGRAIFYNGPRFSKLLGKLMSRIRVKRVIITAKYIQFADVIELIAVYDVSENEIRPCRDRVSWWEQNMDRS